MKRLFLLIPICLFSCADETYLTNQVKKIETIYHEGSKKIEPNYNVRKIESVMAPNTIIEVQAEIENSISSRESQNAMASRTSAFTTTAFDYGVIPGSGGCPSWSEPIGFYMDCEDSGPATSKTGNIGSWTVDSYKNAWLYFCRIDGSQTNLSTFGDRTMVLRLGATNPNPSLAQILVRNFDNEDSSNNNNRFGNYSPNVSNTNTKLYFYYIHDNLNDNNLGTMRPNLGFEYFVMGGYKNGLVETDFFNHSGNLYTDDEDSSNGNWMRWNSDSGPNVSSISQVIVGGANTRIYLK